MRIALSFLLLALAAPCGAVEPTFTKQYDACQEDADGGGPAERLECMTAEIKRQGALLDTAYKAALRTIPAAKQPRLRESQREWLKFSDANCDLFFNPESGSLASEARAYCVMRMTSERAAELSEIAAAK